MTNLVEFLNANAATFLATQAWPMVWQSSLLAVLVAVAGHTVFRKARAQLRYSLWGLVLLRLLVPPSLDLPTSIGHWTAPVVERHMPRVLPLDYRASDAISARELAPTDAAPLPANEKKVLRVPVIRRAETKFPVSSAVLLVFVWLAGMAALSLLLALRLMRFRRILRSAVPPSPSVQALVDEWHSRIGVRWPVRAWEVDADISPALYGLRRLHIVLPKRVIEALDVEQLRAVVVHELAHARRADFLVNWVQIALGIVYFFHPVVWFANRQMRIEREQACDDLALVTTQLDRDGYAESLVRVAECFSAAKFAPTHIGVVETRTHLARRLRRILNRALKPAPRLSLACAAAVLAFAALFGTWRHSEAAPNPTAGSEESSVEMLPLDVHVMDEAGDPVEGAEVQLYGLRTKIEPGSHYGRDGEALKASTGAEGVAQIRYPRFVQERMETGKVSVLVSHKQFVQQRCDVPVDGSAPPIVLLRGGTVRIFGYVGKEDDIVWPIGVLFSGDWGVRWRPIYGARKGLESVELIKPGTHSVWAAHRTKDGTVLFSDAFEFEAVANSVQGFSLSLHPGVRLEGRLDANLPRPIKNGVACVWIGPTKQHEANPQGNPETLLWSARTNTGEDGTFVFESLPKGYAEVAAWCDGAVVAFQRVNGPLTQVLPYPVSLERSRSDVEIPMAKTSTAVVKVETPDGKPLEGAKVDLWPNILWFSRFSTIATPASQSESLRQLGMEEKAKEEIAESLDDTTFHPVTDAAGLATIQGLPPQTDCFSVQHDLYEMPIRRYGPNQHRNMSISLKPGETTRVTVRLQPKGTELLGETTVPAPAATSCSVPEKDPFVVPVTATTPRNRLEGRVVGEDGKPLAGVHLNAWTWCPGNETDTDAEGNFALADFDVDQKEIEVRFTKDGYSPIYMFRQPLGRLTEPLVMTTKTYFEGKVTDSQGQPVPNAIIRADGGPRQADGIMITDTATEIRSRADGAYRFYVQDGAYKVTVTSGREMLVLKDVSIARNVAKTLDVRLTLAPVFRAKVVDSVSGAPVEGVRLYSWRFKEIEGTSNANGDIEITGLPAGRFEFQVDGEKREITRWWSDDAVNPWQRLGLDDEKMKWQRNFDGLEFDVQQDMKPVTIVVEKGARIRGKVVDPDGKPVTGATVAPARTGTGNSLTGDTRFSVRSDKDGNFDMLLPASKTCEYNLIVHDGDYQEWRNWANGVMPPITTQPGDLKEGVALQLRRPCNVRGKVVDDAGKPVPEREVRACAFEMNDNRYYVPTTRTDKDGAFELKYVAPGKHLVQAKPFWLKPSEAPEGTSQVVEVTPDKPVEGVMLVGKPK